MSGAFEIMSNIGRIRLFIGITTLLLLGLVLLAIYTEVIQVYIVGSGSMEPTLQVGDRIIIDKNGLTERFDIVALRDPTDPNGNPLVKRIVGTGGDKIKVEGGILYINGEEQHSRQVMTNKINWPDVYAEVPYDTVYVLGDNRNDSYDSLNFGPVPEKLIIGKMWLTIWPLSRFGFVKHYETVE